MSKRKKMLVGPLPEPQQDYSQYEETEILWGRVALAILILCVAAIGLVSVFSGGETQQNSGIVSTQGLTSMPKVKSATEVREVLNREAEAEGIVQQGTTEEPSKELVISSLELEDTNNAISEKAAEVETATVVTEKESASIQSGAEVPAKPDLPRVISPVSLYNVGLSHAELTHVLEDGKPATPLGYHIEMSDQGIIKVILYTEMQGLNGRVLYHDWYREEERQARVKIPVNIAQQNSYSSKFINHQMLGDWSVKIVDQSGELYGEANFSVR